MPLSSRTAALAYWQGRYVAIDQNEDAIKLAEVSLPAPRVPAQIVTSRSRNVAPEEVAFFPFAA